MNNCTCERLAPAKSSCNVLLKQLSLNAVYVSFLSDVILTTFSETTAPCSYVQHRIGLRREYQAQVVIRRSNVLFLNASKSL